MRNHRAIYGGWRKSLGGAIETPFAPHFTGHVTCILRHAETGLILGEWHFRNLLTNTFMDGFGNGTAFTTTNAPFGSAAYLGASTDSTAPAYTDTAMAGEIASSRTNVDGTGQTAVGYVSGTPDYVFARVSRRFSTTQANGTITKMGLFSASTVGSMWAEALVLDALSNPTSIVKTSAAVLDVIWEIRCTPPQGDTSDTVTIGATSYTLTYRGANVGTSLWSQVPQVGLSWGTGDLSYSETALIVRTAVPSGGTAPVSETVQAYTAGNYFRDYRTSFTAAQAAILVGTNALSASGATAADKLFQVGFSPSLTAGQSATYRFSWTRA